MINYRTFYRLEHKWNLIAVSARAKSRLLICAQRYAMFSRIYCCVFAFSDDLNSIRCRMRRKLPEREEHVERNKKRFHLAGTSSRYFAIFSHEFVTVRRWPKRSHWPFGPKVPSDKCVNITICWWVVTMATQRHISISFKCSYVWESHCQRHTKGADAFARFIKDRHTKEFNIRNSSKIRHTRSCVPL